MTACYHPRQYAVHQRALPPNFARLFVDRKISRQTCEECNHKIPRPSDAMTRAGVVVLIGVALAVVGLAELLLPGLGAGGLLHPARRRVAQSPPAGCRDTTFAGEGVSLKGWLCPTSDAPRGTVVYLHGVADNRTSGAGVIERFRRRGFDVIAYDSRAHGESDGTACTYGYLEKRDLSQVIDTVRSGPVVLIGTSLGAAVALQEAAQDPRVVAVVAAETFADLRTVATERAPFFFTRGMVDRAIRFAQRDAGFQVDAVSPVRAASAIRQAVLLIHGDADVDTRPAHSQRVFDALAGPKRLMMVPGAPHNGSLRGDVWTTIERWVDEVLPVSRIPSLSVVDR